MKGVLPRIRFIFKTCLVSKTLFLKKFLPNLTTQRRIVCPRLIPQRPGVEIHKLINQLIQSVVQNIGENV